MGEVKLFNYHVEEVGIKEVDYITDNLKAINVETQWIEGLGENAVVAILDTGIDTQHPELKDAILDGKDFTGKGSYEDGNGHGTHVAGIIGARKNNYAGIGVAPACKLVIGKVLSDSGRGETSGIVKALNWCVNWRGKNGEKIHVINMSLGSPQYEVAFHEAVKAAVKAGISVVCAMGNEGDGSSATEEISYPAYFPEVIGVGATDNYRNITNFSNTNKEVDVSAPGKYIYSTMPGGKWASLSGTSMACPHVAGAIALIVDAVYKKTGTFPSEEGIYQMIRMIARKKPQMKLDPAHGAGFLSFLPDGAGGSDFETLTCDFYKDNMQCKVNGITHTLHMPPKLETYPAMHYTMATRDLAELTGTPAENIYPFDGGFRWILTRKKGL